MSHGDRGGDFEPNERLLPAFGETGDGSTILGGERAFAFAWALSLRGERKEGGSKLSGGERTFAFRSDRIGVGMLTAPALHIIGIAPQS